MRSIGIRPINDFAFKKTFGSDIRAVDQPEFRKATDTITRIAAITEDKAMYDTREKAIRDQQWALNAVRKEGLEEGEIKLIQTLQEILGLHVSDASNMQAHSLDQLRAMTAELRSQIQKRT